MADQDDRPRVAFLGLGLMGARMAGHVARAGFPLTVWNRSPEVAADLAADLAAGHLAGRVEVADSPRSAAASADVVVTMLADGAVLRSVYAGADGVLAGLRPGAVAVDMGTSGPQVVAELAAAVAAAGAAFVDAPVSGSTAAAESATLTIMAGGAERDVDRVRPVLAVLGRSVRHVGASGAGATLKLAVNSVLFGLTAAVAEALVLLERSGLDPRVAYDVFEESAIAAPAVHYRREALLAPDTAPPSFRLALAAKDLALAAEQAARVGAAVPQLSAAAEVVRDAIAAGLGDADLAAVVTWLRSR